MSRLLGLDVGDQRIGLAVGDAATGEVRPLATIRRSTPERDASTIGRVCRDQAIDRLVVGLPLNMDGSEGAQVTATRAWAAQLERRLGLPLAWRDERLTSVAAEARLERQPRGRSGGPPSRRARQARRARIDREAAAALVQAELDGPAGTQR